MSLENELRERAENQCELCGATENLKVREVPPSDGTADQSILVCEACDSLLDNPEANPNHWHCLNESMWSPVPAVQVTAWRVLKKIAGEGWPQDLLDMLYLEPEVQAWAEEGLEESAEEAPQVRDSNGNLLNEGDSVTIIKDLPVKGAGFTAKQGTKVNNIRLVPDDPTHIQGKVNGTTIFLKTEFLKKA
ncbi:alkylphosphonate utilization protein [Nitratifractor sp.]|uniref:PhnA domain-containing protein n=1 Tax=Nitratifractor sp. TaxID=2268144 RepID=UPI0025EFAF04|nr:alkylphosphonate utilization protein [Nitratifractor sp.]